MHPDTDATHTATGAAAPFCRPSVNRHWTFGRTPRTSGWTCSRAVPVHELELRAETVKRRAVVEHSDGIVFGDGQLGTCV